MTKREQRGRLWLGIFTATLALLAIIRLSFAISSGNGALALIRGVALPAASLWLLWLLWTGDPSARWMGIVFYLFDGGISLAPWVMLLAGAWEVTPPEQAAAGRQIVVQLMLPAMAPFLASSLCKMSFAVWLAFSPSCVAFLGRQCATGGTIWTALRQWREGPGEPTTEEVEIGETVVRTGTLLIADPMYISDPLRVEKLPVGRFPVIARIIRYPEGSARIARISIRLRAGRVMRRKVLGKIGVDSAMVIVLDEQTYQQHWREEGPERIGMTHSPDDNRKIAALIEEKFGLRWHPIDGFRSRFVDPISEDLEAQITEYLESFPEYANFACLYFRVETNNTFDRLMEAMSDASSCQFPLCEDDEEAYLIAFTSGFGDGSYDLAGLYEDDDLLAVEITFIGPEQDKVLEGFPFLRAGSPP